MTTEDIIRMARESGWALTGDLYGEQDLIAQIEYFAQLVAAQERDECAKILEANVEVCASVTKDILLANVAAIRARGEK